MRSWARLSLLPTALAAALALAALSCERSGTPSTPELPPLEPIVFESGPTVSPQGLFVSEATNLTLHAGLGLSPQWSLDELRLYRVSAAGDSLERLGSLFDDGDLTHADEIEGDGRYSERVLGISAGSPQTLYLRLLALASGDNGGSAAQWSAILPLPVAAAPSQSELDAVFALLDQAESDYTALVAGGSSDAEAKAQVGAWLADQPGVAEAGPGPDGNTLWARFDNGLPAGLFLPRYADGPVLGGEAALRPARKAGRRAAPRPSLLPLSLAPRADADPDLAGANQALLLSPLHGWLEAQDGDPCDEVGATFAAAQCPGFGVISRYDEAADLEAFANLDAFGALCIVTHGALLPGGESCLLSGETATLASVAAWYWDLHGPAPTLALLSADGLKRLAVTPRFIAQRNATFPNSLIYLGACHGMDGTLPAALLAAGAGAVCGFDGAVGLAYASGVTRDFWSNVVEGGLVAGEAHDAVSPLVDPGHEHANFAVEGKLKLRFGIGLSNGDFESGHLSGWQVTGDGRVITQLGEAQPSGAYMAIISTGLGYTTDAGSLSQVLCLPVTADSLALRWNLFSEEFLEWCGTVNQDTFDVTLRDAGGALHTLFHRRIDDLCDEVTPAGIAFDQQPSEDDAGVYTTGWRDLALNLAPYAGQTVTLSLAVGDVGDSNYDTAVLLDDIRILESD